MTSVAHDTTMVFAPALRHVDSLILGPLAVAESIIMTFPTPMWGFPDHREFALLPAARAGLWWLQSLSAEGITFLLADPFVLDANYVVDIGDGECNSLEITEPSDALSLVMIALPAAPDDTATANFRAPMVFNVPRQRGMQIVNRDESNELRRPVTLEAFPAQPTGVALQ